MLSKLKQMVLRDVEACEDSTADLPEPEEEIICALGCKDYYVNTSWATLGCHVLHKCEPEWTLENCVANDPDLIPINYLGAIDYFEKTEIWLDLDKVIEKSLPLSDFERKWGGNGRTAMNLYSAYKEEADKHAPSLRNFKPTELKKGYDDPSEETKKEMKKAAIL